MPTIEMIGERLKKTEVQKRKDYLIHQLKSLGMERAADGRNLSDLTLYSLEWMHIEEKNKTARAYGDRS